MPARRVVGIDPGSLHLGFGVVEVAGNRLTVVEAGHLSPKGDLGRRLAAIQDDLARVFERARPTEAAVEALFFAKNVKSALALGQSRGVVLASVARAGLALHEYAATEVKRAVVGTGRAEKEQVAHMVRLLLNYRQASRFDVTDALALAICHAHTRRP